jgi:hypothetical protein
MAYINSEWLNREERAQRITLLTERVTKLAAVIKAGKATDYHIDSFRRDKSGTGEAQAGPSSGSRRCLFHIRIPERRSQRSQRRQCYPQQRRRHTA